MKKITAAQAFSRAWETFKKNPLTHIAIFLLTFLLIYFFVNIILPEPVNRDKYGRHGLQSYFLIFLLVYFVQLLVAVFLNGYALDVVRNQYNGVGEVFSKYIQGTTVFYYFLFSLLLILIPLIITIPFVLVALAIKTGPIVIFGLFLGLFVGFYLSIRLMFVFFLVLDRHSVANAIKVSWKKTEAYVGEIILMILFAVLALFFGLLALIVGALIAIPVIYFAQAVFYNEAVSEPADQTPATEALEQ